MSTLAPIHSPLEPVFAGNHAIPFAFAEQFLHGEHLPYSMKLVGVMHRIWHRPKVLSLLFWALGKVGVLVPYNAQNIPTSLVVTPGRNDTDGLFHIWDRKLLSFDIENEGRSVLDFGPWSSGRTQKIGVSGRNPRTKNPTNKTLAQKPPSTKPSP
jgi:Domain of unknown function (DUF4166)